MNDRRTFLAAIGASGLAAPLAARGIGTGDPARCLILSTWDFGAAANDAAYARLRAGGTLLDAIEAGAMVPEADPANHSVGMAAIPIATAMSRSMP